MVHHHFHQLIILLNITRSGMHYKFLPSYSPNFNPSELGFSAVKAHICRNGHAICTAMGQKDDPDIYVMLHEAVWSITAHDVKAWFHHCGYLL
jgi:hypothetical protein